MGSFPPLHPHTSLGIAFKRSGETSGFREKITTPEILLLLNLNGFILFFKPTGETNIYKLK